MVKESDAIKEQPRLFVLLLKHPACGGGVGGKMPTVLCKIARSHSKQLGWVWCDSEKISCVGSLISLPHTTETTSICCHHLNSSLAFSCKSFSTHQHSHLTLMAPSAVLSDSTWNNTETLVTVKGFNPECFSTHSRGTCADIPGILRWIAPFPGSAVYDGYWGRDWTRLTENPP